MTFLPGSEADQLALCAALDRFDRAEMISKALDLRCGAENEQVRWCELAGWTDSHEDAEEAADLLMKAVA